MKRRVLALGLALLTICSLGAAAFAAEEPIAPIPEEIEETAEPVAEAPMEAPAEAAAVMADEPVAAAAGLPTEETVHARLMAMQEKWPDGTYWGYDSYYVDKNGYKEYACFGFAIMLQEAAFPGLYGPYQKSGSVRIEDIWVGDMLSTPGHTSIVIEVNEDEGYVVLADGNWDESVRWGNVVTAADMGQFVTRWTYYTQKPSRHKYGWYQENGGWYYYEKDVPVKNAWRADGNSWCFLDEDGKMVTGLYHVQIEGYDGWYYFDPRHNGAFGRMLTGWQVIGDDWYCFDSSSGAMLCNSWAADGDTWNHLGSDGKMAVGLTWVDDGGSDDGLYYFNPAHDGTYGNMLTGWQMVNGSWYYFETRHNGKYGIGYVNGNYVIDGVEYAFDSMGRLQYYFE